MPIQFKFLNMAHEDMLRFPTSNNVKHGNNAKHECLALLNPKNTINRYTESQIYIVTPLIHDKVY